MIKYDTTPITLEYHTGPELAEESEHRLIVLVPAGVDPSLTAPRLLELEKATGLQILLLGICQEKNGEPGLRRELVTLAALLQEGRQLAEVRVEIGSNWIDPVSSYYEVGDRIVCFDGQRTGVLQRPLGQLLESNLKADVYVLPGLELQEAGSTVLSQVGAWLGFLLIILGFGLLQVKIVQASAAWIQNALLILSILPEFWLLHYWAGRPG